jgi:hypothetical protein
MNAQPSGEQVNLHLTLTESDVDETVVMLVPISADSGKGWIRIGQVGIRGQHDAPQTRSCPALPRRSG